MDQNSFSTPARAKAPTTIVELVAVIVAIILVFWFFIRPKSAALSEQRASVKQQQATYDQVSKDKADLLSLVSSLQQNQQSVALVDEALPLDTRVTRLQILMDGLVGASGMKEGALNIASPNSFIAAGNKAEINQPYGVNRKLDIINFDLTVTGSIDQLKQLLTSIETNGRVIDVTDIIITRNQDKVDYTLKLKTYSYGAS